MTILKMSEKYGVAQKALLYYDACGCDWREFIPCMRKASVVLIAAFFLLTLTACAKNQGDARPTPNTPDVAALSGKGGENLPTGRVIIDDKRFDVVFYDNETTRALLSKIPLTLMMNELNGKEKYCRLSDALPVKTTEKPEIIREGELMYWSGDTLVLFYSTYLNSYGGYVKLGHIREVSGLKDAVGQGAVQIRFEVGENGGTAR